MHCATRATADLDHGLALHPRTGRFRHVVFADAVRRAPAADFSPFVPPRVCETRTASDCPDDDAFLIWLLDRSGLEGASYRLETLRRRLPSCLRALRVRSVTEARRLLGAQSELLGTALTATVIGVTSFFRDAPVFATLRDEVLPSLLASAARLPLRIWSIGCSDGPELYSVAMLLDEIGMLEHAILLGTDCRPDAIRQARSGDFDPLALREIEPRLEATYFRYADGRWRIDERLPKAATWRVGNVLAVPEPGFWDLILCRNLAIYLTEDAVTTLWTRVQGCLRPGGILVTGKAERPHGARGLSMIKPCIYRRATV